MASLIELYSHVTRKDILIGPQFLRITMKYACIHSLGIFYLLFLLADRLPSWWNSAAERVGAVHVPPEIETVQYSTVQYPAVPCFTLLYMLLSCTRTSCNS